MMMSDANWELIVHRLDTIVKSQDDLKSKVDDMHDKISKMETMQKSIDNLSKWKESVDNILSINDMKVIVDWKSKVDDVVSPTQLKDYVKDIDSLKTFKTKATMIWVVVEGIIFLLLFLNSMGFLKNN